MIENMVFSSIPVVSIVGRSNVGKSALFNRLLGYRVSVVHDSIGVTRDQIRRELEWNGKKFCLVDTGGLEFSSASPINSEIDRQVRLAIDFSNLIVFVVDSISGLVQLDRDVALTLHKSKKPVVLCVNKCDNLNDQSQTFEFCSLGFKDIIPVSSIHGYGTGDLLDFISNKIDSNFSNQNPISDSIKISILGKPNVGKSSLVNKFCGFNRSIVSDIPGTTVDSVDSLININDKNYIIIDTAGIRRKNNVKTQVERYSNFRTFDSAENCDVCLIVIDAFDGITSQDVKIAGISKNLNKACLLIINKWDKLDPNPNNAIEFEKKIKVCFSFLSYAPFLYVSAKTSRNLDKIFSLIDSIYLNFSRRITTGILNSFLERCMSRTPPPSINGKQLKIYYMTQIDIKPPTFVFFVNKSKLFHFSYQRYIENRLREEFDFLGTPLKFVIKQKSDNNS